MNLARTRNGTMVHRRDCPQINRKRTINQPINHAKPWLWADDKTMIEVAWTITHFEYDTCKRCQPIVWSKATWKAIYLSAGPT